MIKYMLEYRSGVISGPWLANNPEEAFTKECEAAGSDSKITRTWHDGPWDVAIVEMSHRGHVAYYCIETPKENEQ